MMMMIQVKDGKISASPAPVQSDVTVDYPKLCQHLDNDLTSSCDTELLMMMMMIMMIMMMIVKMMMMIVAVKMMMEIVVMIAIIVVMIVVVVVALVMMLLLMMMMTLTLELLTSLQARYESALQPNSATCKCKHPYDLSILTV